MEIFSHRIFQISRFPGLTIFLLAMASGATGLAQGAEEQAAPVPAESPSASTAFIPLEKEDVYQELLTEVMRQFEDKKFEESLVTLGKAMELFPRDPFTYNLRGAIRTKVKDYANARSDFENALKEDPQFFPARFNLGEVLFLEGKHDEALQYFEVLNDTYQRNELVEFKLVVLFALTEKANDAKRMIGRMRFPGETPAWYFANAAFLAYEGDPGSAKKYIHTARDLFSPARTQLYEETLTEANLFPGQSTKK